MGSPHAAYPNHPSEVSRMGVNQEHSQINLSRVSLHRPLMPVAARLKNSDLGTESETIHRNSLSLNVASESCRFLPSTASLPSQPSQPRSHSLEHPAVAALFRSAATAAVAVDTSDSELVAGDSDLIESGCGNGNLSSQRGSWYKESTVAVTLEWGCMEH